LVVLHRGVYAVGHTRLSQRAYLWVAHLATGGAISHVSAAWAWGLVPVLTAPIHVTTTGSGRSRRGIHVHRAKALDVEDLNGLPVTSVATTLNTRPPFQLMRALREARYLRILRPDELTGRALKGWERIRVVPVHRTRSELEHWFLGICDTYDLPHPHVNQAEDGKERDFRWPGLATLVVEVDGSQHRWADDRRRDRELFVRTGLTTIRFTGDEPAAEVAKTVSEALHRLRMVG